MMAALHYGLAWLLFYVTVPPGERFGSALIFPLVVFLALLYPLSLLGRPLAALAFQWTGVPGRRAEPTAAEQQRLDGALAAAGVTGELEPVVVDLGGVPFLAVSDGRPRLLWASRAILRDLTPTDLACLVAHEHGHTTAPVPLLHGFVKPLTWLVAFCFAVMLWDFPWLYVALGLVHALAWLRIELWTTDVLEQAADRSAMQRTGRQTYPAALVRCYRLLAGPGATPGIRRRLRRAGLAGSEIEQLLATEDPARPGA